VEPATERLLLRLPTEADAEDVLVMMRDHETVLWNPAPLVVDPQSAREWCLRGADWSDGTHATWHAADRVTGRFVANCSVFAIDGEQSTAKIGYRVAPWARGRGVASQVVDVVTSWAFAELALARMQIEHAVANVASCKVATAAGFSWEGTMRSASVDGLGERHDDHVHGRLASDPSAQLGR